MIHVHIFKKRGSLAGSQILEGVAGKEGDDIFQGGRGRGGGLQFLHKE